MDEHTDPADGADPPDPPTTSGRGQVDELRPGMTGTWQVETRTSIHTGDLDAMTYTRRPGGSGKAMAGDGAPQRITKVHLWPSVGGQSYVFFDDPTFPDLIEQWRVSATILRICAVTENPLLP